MTCTEQAIASDELAELFGPFASATATACALAVSGGGDSTALMVLFADWLRQTQRNAHPHVVLTVDHGLRPASAAEARAVSAQAAALGFRHATLPWPGAKPRTGIQAAAREARYRLMRGYMREQGIASLLTAHTCDDQAETLLMRLARGSGVDGLAAMAPCAAAGQEPAAGREGRELRILRPLLGVAKARLLATLRSRGIGWIEDPSNQAPMFERARLRAARPQLHALGLTDEMLALSARRLLRARAALETVTDRFCAPAAGNVAADALGRITMDRDSVRTAGEEIALRAIARAVTAAGGTDDPVPLAKLEPIAAAVIARDRPAPLTWTLARAMIVMASERLVVEREPGRAPLPRLALARGASALWDGRFVVSAASDFAAPAVEVRPLGEEGLALLRRIEACAGAPARAAALVPSIWLEGKLIAVPPLQHWATADGRRQLRAEFQGMGERRLS
jgi:tRNA(Ile)-lysidine synthase